MRLAILVPAAALAAAAVTPAGATSPVLRAQRDVAGGAVAGAALCAAGSCAVVFEVRPGEAWLHIGASAPAGALALDVTTDAGVARVCGSTASGPLPIAGTNLVKTRVVLDDAACGTPAVTGTVTAYFSADPVPYATAVATAIDDPGRRVGGGL